MNRRNALRLIPTLAAGTVGALSWSAARAQGTGDYPATNVRFILGFPPGGAGDVIARSVGDEAAKRLGKPFIIENRPGAATNIASEFVARSAPDGHTLLLGGSFSHAVNPALFATLRFDTEKDFTPVTKVARAPTVFAVPATLPVNSLKEFIAYARREGEKVSYGSSGIGSPGHLAGAFFNESQGLKMTHIPYKGGGDAIKDLVVGELQMIITSPASILPLVAQGRAKALALTTPGRSRVVPGVPGSDEAGLVDFDFDGWYGFWAPAGTPMPIVEKLHATFAAAVREPAVVERFESLGITPDPSPSAPAFAAFVKESAAHWAKIVAKTGVRL